MAFDHQSAISGLLPCKCGCVPVDGWHAPPETHFAHCPDCGAWAQGDTAQEAVAAWNVQMRAKLGRAA